MQLQLAGQFRFQCSLKRKRPRFHCRPATDYPHHTSLRLSVSLYTPRSLLCWRNHSVIISHLNFGEQIIAIPVAAVKSANYFQMKQLIRPFTCASPSCSSALNIFDITRQQSSKKKRKLLARESSVDKRSGLVCTRRCLMRKVFLDGLHVIPFYRSRKVVGLHHLGYQGNRENRLA